VAEKEYRVVDGHVEVLDGDELLWGGDVDGLVAYKAIALPGTEDGIVVLDWGHRPPGVEAWHPFPNLMRIRPDGKPVWTAELPLGLGEKSYTGAAWREGTLIGFLWANAAELDPATGAVRRTWFTK
jgi:hypothetical protein